MDKLTTGVAYGTSAGNAGFWALQLLDKVEPPRESWRLNFLRKR